MAAGTFSGRESRALGGIRESKSSMEPTPIVPSISRCWAGVFEMYRMALVSARGDELLVVGRRHEAVHLLRIAELDDDHPALAVRIAVDRLGLLHELAVRLHHLAAEGREEIGHCLDRLHHAEGLHGRHLGADLGQLDEDHVAQLLLGEGGDADPRLVSLEIGRAHDRTPVTATSRMPSSAWKKKKQ